MLRYLEQYMASYIIHGRHSVNIDGMNENTSWVAVFVSGVVLQGKKKKKAWLLSLGNLTGWQRQTHKQFCDWDGWEAGKLQHYSPNCACRSRKGNQRSWHLRLFLKDEQVFARQRRVGRTLWVWKQNIQQHGAAIGQRSVKLEYNQLMAEVNEMSVSVCFLLP